MNTLIKNLINKARLVMLTKKERADIRQRLVAFMRGNQAVAQTASAGSWLGRIYRPVLAGVLSALLVGGGVSFASENTLPGDLLYPVKIHVNEEVRAALTTSAQAKADWEATRAERRLEEAEKLAADGKLNDSQKTEMEQRFIEHAEKAHERIAALEAGADLKAAAEVGGRLEGSLRAHGRILSRLRNLESVVALVQAQTAGEGSALPLRAAAFLKATSTVNTGSAPRDGAFEQERNHYRDTQEREVLKRAREELKLEVEANDEGDTLPAVKMKADEGVNLGL